MAQQGYLMLMEMKLLRMRKLRYGIFIQIYLQSIFQLLILNFLLKAADSNRVEPIKIVDSDNGGFDLKLISRKEDTQVRLVLREKQINEYCLQFKVKALQDYYSNVKTLRVKRLELLDNIGHVVIPRIALSFVALFWTIGLSKYSNPEFTVDWISDFITSPLAILGVIVLAIFIPLVSFCYSRCFKR